MARRRPRMHPRGREQRGQLVKRNKRRINRLAFALPLDEAWLCCFRGILITTTVSVQKLCTRSPTHLSVFDHDYEIFRKAAMPMVRLF